jgi:hypothetical protein
VEGFMGSGVEALEKVVLGRDKMGILVLERMVASSSLRAGGGDPEVEPRLAILRISGGPRSLEA